MEIIRESFLAPDRRRGCFPSDCFVLVWFCALSETGKEEMCSSSVRLIPK